MRYTVILLAVLGAPGAVSAQTARLSQHEAMALIDARRTEVGCWTIAYGFAGNGNSPREITERLKTLERHGVLTTRPGQEPGRLEYTLTDPSVFTTLNGRACVLMQPPDGPTRVIKIEDVKGKSGWQGAIIYAHIDETAKRFTPFFHRFAQAERLPTHIDAFAVRALARHNASTKKWEIVAVDIGQADGSTFHTDSVTTALDED